MLKIFFSNFVREKLVHELKFGAIHQLSGIYYTSVYKVYNI